MFRLCISALFLCLSLVFSSSSHAGWCEDHSGIIQYNKCFCPSLGVFITKATRRKCMNQVIRLSAKSINQFNKEIFDPCEPNKFINYNLRCPGHMLLQLEENQNADWLGVIKSPNEICLQVEFNDPFFEDTESFEGFLNSQSNYKLNTRNDLISSCLKGLDYPKSQKQAFVAKYYRDMSRLKKGVLGNIQSIANIDSLLGNPPANDDFWDLSSGVCENQHVELSVSWCRKFKEDCTPQGGLSQMALRTFDHLPIYFDLMNKRNTLDEETSEYKKVSLALASIEGTFPWIKGDKFKARVNKRTIKNMGAVNIKAAIREQFLEDRKNHLKNLKIQQGATHCLNSSYPVDGCNQYNEALATTPDLSRIKMQELSFDQDKDLYDENGNEKEITKEQEIELRGQAQVMMANGYLEDAKCIENMRGLRSDVNWQVGMAAGQLAITGLTMGAGAIALPGAVAARAGGFVARAVNHSKLAWSAMKTGVGRGRLLVKGALLGSSAVGESYLMQDEVRSLVDSCDSHLPTPSNVKTKEDYTPSCPRAHRYNNGKIDSLKMSSSQTDWQDCALSSALMGLGLVPILGDVAGRKIKKLWKKSKLAKENANQILMVEKGVAKRLLSDSLESQDLTELMRIHKDRLEDAVAVLGRDLKEIEKLAILKAHYVGFGELGKDGIHLAGLENYTQGHINAKARALFKAGFKRADVQSLMDTGITGSALDLAQRTARVERFLELAEANPEIKSATINAAKKRDLESFEVVNGNLVLANKPNQIMIRANIDVGEVKVGPQVINRATNTAPKPNVSIQDKANEVLKKMRRELAMSPEELPILKNLNHKTAKWVQSPRLGRRVLCGKTKKKSKTYRREKTNSDISKLKKPKSFGYHGKVPSPQVLDRHLSSTKSNGYMGVATTMNSSMNGFAGNSGNKRANICISPGALICIVGGAESEVVLMDSKWNVCP